MKFKGYYIFTLLIYSTVLIILGIVGTKGSIETRNIATNENYIINEKQEQTLSIFTKDTTINGLLNHNNNYIAYGNKDNYPYISVLNNTKTQVMLANINTTIKGSITNISFNGLYHSADVQHNKTNDNRDFFITSKSFIPYYKKQLTINYTKDRVIAPKYLVIHETGNTNIGADANAHYRYWSTNPNAKASTHFVVDSKQIYQMLELNQMAWHVGDNKGYSNISNTNSIGIEIAVNKDGNYEQAKQYAIDLAIAIMNYLNMDISQLKTHNNASGKNCPEIILKNNTWDDFTNKVNIGLKK